MKEQLANGACVSIRDGLLTLLTLLTKCGVLSNCYITPVFHLNQKMPLGVFCAFTEYRWMCMYSACSYAGGESHYCLLKSVWLA